MYIKVVKRISGLPQAGSLGHDLFEECLNKEGYIQSIVVPRLWNYKTRNIQFTLVVDDFGIKCIKKEDIDHFIHLLEKYYDVTINQVGKEYNKIHLDWDYGNRLKHLSIQTYLEKALKQFQPSTTHQDSHYPQTPSKYGAEPQLVEYDYSPPVGKDAQKRVQKVNGKCLWYARAVNGTLLTALSTLTAQQANSTTEILKHVKQFLEYCASQEPAVLTYCKSEKVLTTTVTRLPQQKEHSQCQWPSLLV